MRASVFLALEVFAYDTPDEPAHIHFLYALHMRSSQHKGTQEASESWIHVIRFYLFFMITLYDITVLTKLSLSMHVLPFGNGTLVTGTIPCTSTPSHGPF